MILSYNVVKEDNFSSEDESLGKESIRTESALLRDSSLNNSKMSRSSSAKNENHFDKDILQQRELRDFLVKRGDPFANSSPIQNCIAKMNYPSSNECSFSGKEENFIQKDVLNMLNSSLKSKRSSAGFQAEEVTKKDDKEDSISSSSSSLIFMDLKMKELQLNDTYNNKNFINLSKSEIFPKDGDEKIINISVDGSIISDVSQGSKNYIPKASLVQNNSEKAADSPPNKGKNIEKIKEDLKPNAISYYNSIFPSTKFESENSFEKGMTFDLKIFDEKPQQKKETKLEKPEKSSKNKMSSSSPAREDLKKMATISISSAENEKVEGPIDHFVIPELQLKEKCQEEEFPTMNLFLNNYNIPYDNSAYNLTNHTNNIQIPLNGPTVYKEKTLLSKSHDQQSIPNDSLRRGYIRGNPFQEMPNPNQQQEEEEEMFNSHIITNPNQFGNIFGQGRNLNLNLNVNIPQMSNNKIPNIIPQRINSQNSFKKLPQKSIQNYVDMSNEELVKYCHIICKDQAGCRFLQKKIDENPTLANECIYYAIFDKILELMYDGFANYFVQKVVDCISEDKLEKVVLMIAPEFFHLGHDPHGTRVIQKIIENIKSDQLLQIFTELLIPNLDAFIVNPNANHILIKYASAIAFPRNNVIFDYLNLKLADAATQKHSCCALQKCIEAANDIQKTKLFNTIADNSNLLITNPYGNYVVQFVVSFGEYEINARIAKLFLSDIAYLSKQKFSSNVIEKCFDYCDDKTKFLIVKEVCNPRIIPELLLDMYGNYVLQKALSFAVEPYRSIFISSIGPYLEKLKVLPFGSKLYMKLIIAYPELKAYANPKESSMMMQARGNNNNNNSWNSKNKKQQKEFVKQSNPNFMNNTIPSMNMGFTPMMGMVNLNPIGMNNMNMPLRNMNPNMGIASIDQFGMNPYIHGNMILNNQFQPNLTQYEYMMNRNMNMANLMQFNQNQMQNQQNNDLYFNNSNYKMNPYS